MMGTIVDFEQLYLDAKRRICELELVIKSHGIPVKTFAGGEAHYALGSELEAERAALRQQQGEPVAYIEPDRHFPVVVPANEAHAGQKSTWIPLYREAAPRVPEGWKMVPVEPTELMRDACVSALTVRGVINADDYDAEFVYRAVIAAAPEPKE